MPPDMVADPRSVSCGDARLPPPAARGGVFPHRGPSMRLLSLGLAVLIALLQVPLWIGKGSWLRVWEVDRQLVAQREVNGRLLHRNETLDAEVRDLKTGYEAIEERARAELGMIRQDELFIQVLGSESAPAPRPASPGKGVLTPPTGGR